MAELDAGAGGRLDDHFCSIGALLHTLISSAMGQNECAICGTSSG